MVTGFVHLTEHHDVAAEAYHTLRNGQNMIIASYRCILTMCKMSIVIIHYHGHFVVVDSHPRNRIGLSDNGKSGILHFACLDDTQSALLHWLAHTSGSKINLIFEMCAFDISVVCGNGFDVSPAPAGNKVFDGGVSVSSLLCERRKTSNIDTDISDILCRYWD